MLRKFLLLLVLCILLPSCSFLGFFFDSDKEDVSSDKEEMQEQTDTTPALPIREALDVAPSIPSADGVAVFSSAYVNIDYSNSSMGYIMVEYVGSHTGKIKFRVVDSYGETYTYDLHDKTGYQTFPLSCGSGSYTLTTYEQSSGTEYYTVDTQTINVTLNDEFVPFLYSNQYVNFTESSIAVKEATELYAYTSNDIEFIESVYNYTISNIEYDYPKAEYAVNGELSGYLPDIDETISSGMGICFDYAAVMSAMLRSQNIPTKLVIGYAGEIYHAWINVYTEETGWVKAIEFDGTDWKLMDPTFADSGGDTTFIGTGDNYAEKYTY